MFRFAKMALLKIVLLLMVSSSVLADVRIAKPDQLVAPRPLADGSGKYFSPFTVDNVIADWVDKGIQLNIGNSVGGLIGAELANQALSEIPVLGAMLGKEAGEYLGSRAALSAIGGEEYIRSTSDQSFVEIEDLAVFMYARHARHKDYKKVFEITVAVYPELQDVYYSAIVDASKEAFAFEIDLGD